MLRPARIFCTRKGRPSRQLKAVDTLRICPPWCGEKRENIRRDQGAARGQPPPARPPAPALTPSMMPPSTSTRGPAMGVALGPGPPRRSLGPSRRKGRSRLLPRSSGISVLTRGRGTPPKERRLTRCPNARRSRQPADCACACARRGAALKGAAPRIFPRIRSFPGGTLAATGGLRDEVRNESPEDLYPKRRKPHRLRKACFSSSWVLQLSRRLAHLCLPRFSPGSCGTQNWRFLELKM